MKRTKVRSHRNKRFRELVRVFLSILNEVDIFGNAGKEHDEGVFEEGIPICASYDELATQRVFSGYM